MEVVKHQENNLLSFSKDSKKSSSTSSNTKMYYADQYPQQNHSCCGSGSVFTKESPSHFQKPRTTTSDNNEIELDPGIATDIAKCLNELSVEEREQVADDIHGVATKVDEAEAFITIGLEFLESSIQTITGPIRAAYDLAMSIDSNYVTNREFRLLFLRADSYDIEKAALRLLTHFKYKLELFGKDKLVKSITYDDLSPSDIEALSLGNLQHNNVKDNKGRTVLYGFRNLEKPVTFESSMRAFWYQFMLAIESSPEHGTVLVFFNSFPSDVITMACKRANIVKMAIPLQLAAIHCCYVENKMHPLAKPFLNSVGKTIQIRTRFHFEDTAISCLYTLQTFGINPTTVPLDVNGLPQIDTFLKVLEEQKLLQKIKLQQKLQQYKLFNNQDLIGTKHTSTNTNTTPEGIIPTEALSISIHITSANNTSNDNAVVLASLNNNYDQIVPTSQDILMGRGHLHRTHAGNLALEKLIEKDLPVYKNASRLKKGCLVVEIVKRIHASGGRFLHQKNNPCTTSKKEKMGITKTNNNEDICWVIADEKVTHNCVSSRFRNELRKVLRRSGGGGATLNPTTTGNCATTGATSAPVISQSGTI